MGQGWGQVSLLNGVGRQGFPRRWDLEQGTPGGEGVSVLVVKMPLSQGGRESGAVGGGEGRNVLRDRCCGELTSTCKNFGFYPEEDESSEQSCDLMWLDV